MDAFGTAAIYSVKSVLPGRFSRKKMRLSILFTSIVVLVAVVLMPVAIAWGQETNPSRTLPDAVHKGETFDVTVDFTAPVDKFNAAGLTDLAPDGWNVLVDEVWSTPDADAFTAKGNKAEIGWFGEPEVGFDRDISFTALYKVTVPDDAELGIYTFDGFLGYWIGPEGPYTENVTGSSQVEVVAGSAIGVWWIVGIVVAIVVIVAAVLLVRRRKA
jgi:hypothetical protein